MNYTKLKKWHVRATADDIASSERAAVMAKELSLTPLTAQLLINRGCADIEEARKFLSKETELLHDPFLLKDMDKAAERIVSAVKNREKIIIFGDYDVDGVTSVCILDMYLTEKGADVSYYIPCRSGEGYGMSEVAVRRFAEEGVQLIITVDTGITAIEEAAIAKAVGVDVVITDHHECRNELPDAVAVVDPRRPDDSYPFSELAGVGVVFKLLCALETKLRPESPVIDCIRDVSRSCADLVAIGTVADVMPIKDENRLIVAYGLEMMEREMRPGLAELLEASRRSTNGGRSGGQKRKITSALIGYTIAPRINAAGRIADASIAVELFLTKDRARARESALKLCEINRERQLEENKIAEEAYAKITVSHAQNDPVIVLADENWHHGVIGIVASRVTEKFDCPSILISFEGSGSPGEREAGAPPSPDDIGKGSGRSIHGLNLVEALTACDDLLIKYGGHELAAGLTIYRKNLPEFKRRINEYAVKCLGSEPATVHIEADAEITPADITLQQATELYKLEPFGVSNPVPLFAAFGFEVIDVAPVGGGRHTRLTLRKDGVTVVGMCFCQTGQVLDIYRGDTVDLLCNLDINEFQNNRTVQFIVRDVRPASAQLERELYEYELWGRVRRGADADADEVVPSREDFAAVYNLLRREIKAQREIFTTRALLHLLSTEYAADIGYTKLRIIIGVFEELGFFRIDELGEDVWRFGFIFVKAKTSLDRSTLYRRLKYRYDK